ncbi:MAT1-domain-containing protein, partial [Caulochytrium protostelioides]
MAEAILNDAFGEEVSCPVCKADRFLNPSLKLLVSPCFHRMCEACINRIYTQGPAPCPTCQSDEGKTNILRKSNFVLQTFDNLDVEKEVGLRRHLSAVFNKRLEDFDGDLRAYNDYLEHVEGL